MRPKIEEYSKVIGKARMEHWATDRMQLNLESSKNAGAVVK